MLNTETLIRILNTGKILFALDPCEKCGSAQRFKHSGECFGCKVERETKLSFSQVCEQAWSNNMTATSYRYVSLAEYHHDKRRGNAAKAMALSSGRDLYYGEACDRCGCNLRRSSNGRCEGCLVISIRFRFDKGEREEICAGRGRKMITGKNFPVLTTHFDRIMREVAKELGERIYVGYPCDCGNTKRYTLRGQCVSCVTTRNKKKPAPARTEAGEFDHLFE